MANKISNEKVYLTRDESSNIIWVWRKPTKGLWSPQKVSDCDIISYRREDIDSADCYLSIDFKKKFGFLIHQKTKRCDHLSERLLNNEDYKLFSNDPNRKQ